MINEVFGDEDADGVSGAVPVDVADVVEDWGGDLSVGRVDDFELDGNLAVAPFVGERLGFLLVDLNGDRGQCAGVGGAREGEGLHGGQE